MATRSRSTIATPIEASRPVPEFHPGVLEGQNYKREIGAIPDFPDPEISRTARSEGDTEKVRSLLRKYLRELAWEYFSMAKVSPNLVNLKNFVAFICSNLVANPPTDWDSFWGDIQTDELSFDRILADLQTALTPRDYWKTNERVEPDYPSIVGLNVDEFRKAFWDLVIRDTENPQKAKAAKRKQTIQEGNNLNVLLTYLKESMETNSDATSALITAFETNTRIQSTIWGLCTTHLNLEPESQTLPGLSWSKDSFSKYVLRNKSLIYRRLFNEKLRVAPKLL